MTNDRPNPDALLARVQAHEARQQRGKLKIFFGASPGVGKTYAMLEAGRKLAKEGVDVVVGYVEPHVRPETAALVLGLDVLPRRAIEYRGRTFQEFDLQVAIARHPAIILVDELAHTNTQAPSETVVVHSKRWRDVEQLLLAGIDVYTTLNVQHLESVNDIVAKITGVVVRETVPDSIFDSADEVELVDLAPDDLIDRLKEGKVYVPGQAERALEHFFNKGNLIALRELALRRMAERVELQMTDYREHHDIQRTWPASERLLVCVGPSPSAANLVRATRRMAAGLRAQWIAAHIESPGDARLPSEARARLTQTLHLAEQLGAETVTLAGSDVAEELIAYARQRNVNKIIIGKPLQPWWREWMRGSLVYELARKCGDIDVYIISGSGTYEHRPNAQPVATSVSLTGYWAALGMVAICTIVGHLLQPFLAPVNISMIFLLGTVAIALRYGRGAAALSAVLNVLAFDFFFVKPFLTFAIDDTEYLLTFLVMLVTGLTISGLAARVRWQIDAARQREARTAALYSASQDFVNDVTLADVLETITKHIGGIFQTDVYLLLPEPSPGKTPARLETLSVSTQPLSEHDLGVAQWVYEHQEKGGRGTDTLPSSPMLFLPLPALDHCAGVLGIRVAEMSGLLPEQQRLLETFAGQIALVLERIQSAAAAQHAQVQYEAEQLRNSLLSAVSHDLRTPLAAIAGASSTLVDETSLDGATRRELAVSIFDESERLNRLVANLLDMTRLDAGALVIHKQWNSVPELIGGVLQRLANVLRNHSIATDIPSSLPLVQFDELLMHQVLTNLLENAARYSPTESRIEVAVRMHPSEVEVMVLDAGAGLSPEELPRLFEKFYRSPRNAARHGTGLGLAICQGIVALHDGRIWAENRPTGGAKFSFTLPQTSPPPTLPEE